MLNDLLKNKKNLVIAVVCIFLVFIVALIYVSSEANRQARLNAPETEQFTEEDLMDEDETVDTGESAQVSPPPQVNYTDYGTPPSMPQLPQKVSVLRLSRGLPQTEVTTLGERFGFNQVISNGDEILVYNIENPERYGFLQVNKKKGSMLFRSFVENPSVTQGTDPKNVASQFLQKLGFVDPTIACDITYSRTDVSGATFVECHRSWDAVGLPIVNLAGLLNVPENTPLSNLALGMVDTNETEDPRIVNVSTGQSGFPRPDDFNSAVVVVGQEGRVLAARSNLKRLSSTQDIDITTELVNADDAWQQIVSGKPHTVLTVLAGEGNVDPGKVFPAGQAVASGTTVSDFNLYYVETPEGSQEYEVPTYIVRGNTNLSSGYKALYVRALPAHRLGLSAATQTLGSVAGVYDINTNSLAQGPDPSTLKLRTLTLVPSYPETAESVAMAQGCIPSDLQLSPQVGFSPYGTLGQWTIPPFTGKNFWPGKEGTWYLIPAPEYRTQLPEINAVVAAFDQLSLPNANTGKGQIREMDNLLNEWRKYNLCPLRLTGGSPTLFLYAPVGTQLTVLPQAQISYADPHLNNSAWNVDITGDGLSANGVERDYIYYEYATPVSYTRPQTGWNVAKADLTDLAGTISAQLTLTQKEESRLAFELNHAAVDVNSSEVFVGLLPQATVDAQLPLSVASQTPVTVSRLHFYVGNAQGSVRAPQLTPLTRSEYMAVELGAVAQK